MKNRQNSFTIVIVAAILGAFILSACSKDGRNAETNTKGSPLPSEKTGVSAAAAASPTPTKAPQKSSAPATPTPSRNPDPVIDAQIIKFFYEDDIGNQLIADCVQCDYNWIEGKGLSVYPVSQDPQLLIEAKNEKHENIDLTKYPVMKVRLSNQTPGTIFEVFLLRGESEGSEENIIQKDIPANTDGYIDIIIDLNQDKNAEFFKSNDGILTNIRFDGINLDPVREEIELAAGEQKYAFYIDYIGFFSTAEDAQNWNPGHVVNRAK